MRKWISKNQGIFIALIVNVCVLVYTFGCESKVKSLTSADMLTRDEFIVVYNSEIHRIELDLQRIQDTGQVRFADLTRQDEIKSKLFDAVAIATTAGGINLAGLITLLGTVSAVGLGIDNRIKDKVIRNRPLNKDNVTKHKKDK